jgi:hypothetical protein
MFDITVEAIFKAIFLKYVGRDDVVCIATRYGLYGSVIESRWRFSSPVQTGLGDSPACYTTGTGSFPGAQLSGSGIDHPPHRIESKLKKE